MAKVESISKFGFVADGKKYRYDEVTIPQIQIIPGALLDLQSKPDVIAPESVKVDVERAKHFVPKYFKKEVATSAGLTKDEWAQKDQRISRQGVIQAAVIALAPVVGLEQLASEAMKLATQMLEFVNPKE